MLAELFRLAVQDMSARRTDIAVCPRSLAAHEGDGAGWPALLPLTFRRPLRPAASRAREFHANLPAGDVLGSPERRVSIGRGHDAYAYAARGGPRPGRSSASKP